MRPRIAEILEVPCVGEGGGPRGPCNISVLHTIRHADLNAFYRPNLWILVQLLRVFVGAYMPLNINAHSK